MSETFLGGTVCQECESGSLANEEMFDRIVRCRALQLLARDSIQGAAIKMTQYLKCDNSVTPENFRNSCLRESFGFYMQIYTFWVEGCAVL